MVSGGRFPGFTVVELTVILVLIGVLAVAVLSRFFMTNDFEARGYYDYVANTMRYAQRTAVARRRMVYVKLGTSTAQV